MAPKVQTTSVKNAENGLLWARWSAFWAKQCRTWCVVRTRTSEHTRYPLIRTQTPQHASGRRCPRAGHRVNVRVIGPTCASKGPGHHLSCPDAQQVARTRISGQRAESVGARVTTATNRSNFARNSHKSVSNYEYRSLELQRFWMLLKNDRWELCATFRGGPLTFVMALPASKGTSDPINTRANWEP